MKFLVTLSIYDINVGECWSWPAVLEAANEDEARARVAGLRDHPEIYLPLLYGEYLFGDDREREEARSFTKAEWDSRFEDSWVGEFEVFPLADLPSVETEIARATQLIGGAR